MESININSNINLYYIPMTKLKTTTIDVYIHRDLNEEEYNNALINDLREQAKKYVEENKYPKVNY
uniref:hypothetical protein n=1 Tax=uncultured Veillonella sp. TaxID=159268 RepID=UPI0025FB6189